MSNWKPIVWWGVAVAAGAAAIVGSSRVVSADAAEPKAAAAAADPAVARGDYLVKITGCNDCHTPLTMGPMGPEPDMKRMLSGHPESMAMPAPPSRAPGSPWTWSGAATLTAFAGPWGISYARNLTPDQETGLGLWTEEQFVRAMRTGQHQGSEGRMILPPMPWQAIAAMTDEDIHALWSYLRSVPAIKNNAPQSVPAPLPPAV